MTDGPIQLTLPENKWSQRSDICNMLDVIDPDNDQCRFVGGAVRDTLLGLPVKDVDMATKLMPDEVMQRLKAGGIKVVATGIDHGTVTAVLDQGPIEITTLRADVATDGRHATVAFSRDWREDAARRDFTFNALYADPKTGAIFDYFGGQDDLDKGVVRFIGDANKRITEDYLRILRFFRFDARFGKGPPDAQALAACTTHAASMKALSRERISNELLNVLGGDGVLRAFDMMRDARIWPHILPEMVDHARLQIGRLVEREQRYDLASGALVRLAAIIPSDSRLSTKLATRLRLSRRKSDTLGKLVDGVVPDASNIREIAYRIGTELARFRALLWSDDDELGPALSKLENWKRPQFPFTGRDVMKYGLSAGPIVSKALAMVEQRWIDTGFPDVEQLELHCAEIVHELQ